MGSAWGCSWAAPGAASGLHLSSSLGSGALLWTRIDEGMFPSETKLGPAADAVQHPGLDLPSSGSTRSNTSFT